MSEGIYLNNFMDEYYELEDEEDICDLVEGMSLHDGIDGLMDSEYTEREDERENIKFDY
ncbi:MAG: hypothetical protein MK033_09075 [Candidatus Caenarcaniphilales bacterium]|nr:hypothetical protein [Candidatus Caenarcaniphilales bacterium]